MHDAVVRDVRKARRELEWKGLTSRRLAQEGWQQRDLGDTLGDDRPPSCCERERARTHLH